MKTKLFFFCFFAFLLGFTIFGDFVYSSNFNVCGIDFNHNWFEVKDDSNNTVFLLDKDGDVFIMGKNNVGSNPALRSFKINDAIYFNSLDYPVGKVYKITTFPTANGIIFKNSLGDIAKITQTGLYTKGDIAYQNSKAKCPADGWGYCSSDLVYKENRNFYCDITGSKSGKCEYSVTSTYNCNNDNYYSCSGNNKILRKFRCTAGNCAHYQDDVISSCSAYQYCYGAGLCGNYVWNTGSWGSCSAPCGSGSQTRSVTCTRSHDGAVVDNSYCNPSTKPATTQSCSVSCSFTYGSWGSCSAPCGSGTQTRSAVCKNQFGTTISNSYCGTPVTSQSCSVSCSFSYGSWGSCSAPCGSGSQTRSASCINQFGTTISNSYCGTPSTSQSCYISCSFSYGSWGSCSAYCGSGTQTRSASCINQLGQSISSYYCGSPSTSQSCYSSCNWNIGSWGSCSVSCGGGTQSRSLSCYSSLYGYLSNYYCSNALGYTPATSQTCNTQGCASWVTGPWGYCYASESACEQHGMCKGDRTRSVRCLDSYGNPTSGCSIYTKPADYETCTPAKGATSCCYY